jgi:hypothetical protein
MKTNHLYTLLSVLCLLPALIYLMSKTVQVDQTPPEAPQNVAAVPNDKSAEDIPKPVTPSVSENGSVVPDSFPKQDNWTWLASDGKIYNNVVITKIEADRVTVRNSDGEATINIALLPYSIQKLLNYDPELAAQAAAKR